MDLMSNIGEYQIKESPGRIMWEHQQNKKPFETWFFQRGKNMIFTGGWVSCCWVQKRDDAEWSENCMPGCNTLENGYLSKRKGGALYQRVSELLLSPKEGWRGMKWKVYGKVRHPERIWFVWLKLIGRILLSENF